MRILAFLIALCIFIIGTTFCLVKYALIKLNQLLDDDETIK